MSTVHETIYPVLPAEPGTAELKAAFTPTAAGIRFVRRQSRQEATAVLIMVQLKLLQRLGYFPILSDVPPVIIASIHDQAHCDLECSRHHCCAFQSISGS